MIRLLALTFLLVISNSLLAECMNDYQCGYNAVCVKADTSYRVTGVCTVREAYRRSQGHNQPYTSPRVRVETGCSGDWQCGYQQSCIKRGYETRGVCGK